MPWVGADSCAFFHFMLHAGKGTRPPFSARKIAVIHSLRQFVNSARRNFRPTILPALLIGWLAEISDAADNFAGNRPPFGLAWSSVFLKMLCSALQQIVHAPTRRRLICLHVTQKHASTLPVPPAPLAKAHIGIHSGLRVATAMIFALSPAFPPPRELPDMRIQRRTAGAPTGLRPRPEAGWNYAGIAVKKAQLVA